MARWRQSKWGNEISLEYGKGIRDYTQRQRKYRVYGSNGPIGWADIAISPRSGVILGRKGAYRGVFYSKEPFYVIDTAYYVVAKSELDMRWLYYAITYHKLGEIDDGSPIPSTTRAAVYVRDVEIPPAVEQQRIASILGALDDKIDLNRRTNETLEAMAQAIFKDWFVDFGPTRAKMEGRAPYLTPETWALFPSQLEKADLPSGWSVRSLAELTSKIGSGATPHGGSTVYMNSGTSLIRSQNVHDHHFVWDGLAYITEADAEKLKGVTVRSRDVLINITGNSILRTCVVDDAVLPARVNQHVAIVRAQSDVSARFLHQYLVRESSKEHLLGNDAGASRAAVTKGHLEAFPIACPPKALMEAFDRVTELMFDRISKSEFESRTLATTRNLLLPKLMSGELRVREAERIVEAAL